MQLALFTPGACIWPVYRNFESFIAALGTPDTGAQSVSASLLYPARQRSDSAVQGISPEMDRRLTRLHRELYSALLRPAAYFKGEQRLFADVFWPDLRHTAVDALFEALAFYFTGRVLHEIDVPRGLSLLRAVFFNHEAADPELWLSATAQRLQAERRELPLHQGSFNAPPTARVEDLAFCIHGAAGRPALSAGWVCGEIRRQFDGRLRIDYRCGREPGLADEQHYARQRAALDAAAAAQLRTVFGWREARAA